MEVIQVGGDSSWLMARGHEGLPSPSALPSPELCFQGGESQQVEFSRYALASRVLWSILRILYAPCCWGFYNVIVDIWESAQGSLR